MPASSSTRLDRLTPEQASRIKPCLERWTALRLDVRPGDRAAAEAGVASAYRMAGLSPPAIAWCNGPVQLASIWERELRSPAVGASVVSAIVHDVRAQTHARVMARVGRGTRQALVEGFRSAAVDDVCLAVEAAVDRRARNLRQPLWTRFGDMLRRAAHWPRGSLAGWLAFSRAGTSPYAMGWLAPYDFLRETCGFERETEGLSGLELIAANAGWMVPHEKVCWLSARHTALAWDARGRLHAAKGPALAFPDGWSVFAWKGIEVPRLAIDAPSSLTLERIECEHDILVRRCLIEILTPQRFVALGGAAPVASDETGILWRRTWAGDSWAAVEVEDGTPGPDGVRKRYFLQVPAELRTARAAVAWSYGLSEQQYARLLIRT